MAWVLSEPDRARRFLDLTGLNPDNLRESVGEPATMIAVIDFLCSHEPDLIAAAESLGIQPGTLASLRDRIA